MVWAAPLSLATTNGIQSIDPCSDKSGQGSKEIIFSFPPVTEMFHFAGLPLDTLCIQV